MPALRGEASWAAVIRTTQRYIDAKTDAQVLVVGMVAARPVSGSSR